MIRCTRCKLDKDQTEFIKRKFLSGKIGFQPHCKTCRSNFRKQWEENNKIRNENNYDILVGKKFCTYCKNFIDKWLFTIDLARKDGLMAFCKNCEPLSAKERRVKYASSEKIYPVMKVCPKCNLSKSTKDYFKAKDTKGGLGTYCKSCISPIVQQWSKETGWQKKYYKENKNKFQVYRHKRRAKLKDSNSNVVAATSQEILELFQKYNFCLNCGSNEKLTLDHIVPIVNGGTNELNNLQILCGSCNSRKSTKTIDYRHTGNLKKESVEV